MIASEHITQAPPLQHEAAMDARIANAMYVARLAQKAWLRTSYRHRCQLLRKLRHLIANQCAELAAASATTRGRPSSESMTAEVLPLLEACKFVEHELANVLATKRIGRRSRPIWLMGTSSVIVREPYGVILIIGPGNYPLLLPGVQLIQAIMAGNAVLLKPGMHGTAVAKLLIDLMVQAGFDKNLCTLLDEQAESAIAAIEQRPDKVVFTGSTITGKRILRQLSQHLIPSTMELSGCDAVIIREDADLELAAASVAFGLTLNDGATCMAPRRVFVNTRVAKRFEQELRSELQTRLRDGTYFWSLDNEGIVERFSASLQRGIQDAISEGATIIHGGMSEALVRLPLVLSNVPKYARIQREDHFAPLVSIVHVESDLQALKLTNDHDLGLGASIFTSNFKAARKIAVMLAVGVVSINDMIIPSADPRLPFGGRKHSGFGSTQGAEGLLEMTMPKVISVSRRSTRRAYAPLGEKDGALFTAFAQMAHSHGFRARAQAMMSLIREGMQYQRRHNKKY